MKKLGNGYYVYERGRPEGKIRKGVLIEEGRRSYFRCPHCGEIMWASFCFDRVTFDREGIYDSSNVCTICRRCGTHFWVAVNPSRLDRPEILKIVKMVRETFLPVPFFDGEIAFKEKGLSPSRIHVSLGRTKMGFMTCLAIYEMPEGYRLFSGARVICTSEKLERLIRMAAEEWKNGDDYRL